ncbi:hypothetical protein [Halocynthiibacter namhaensis]|uniref:hypothetical protein n=1 Tax=Halocynthiibacter namhaensis TaxID=1290553 RepID=UPI00057961E7|nr:hypothetical protein [Halocynthiibacter namhaensis]
MIVEHIEVFAAAHVVGVAGVESISSTGGSWVADTSSGPETLLNSNWQPSDVVNWRIGFPTENGVLVRDFSTGLGHEISTFDFQTADGQWHKLEDEIDLDKLTYPPPLGGLPFRVFLDEDNHITLLDQGNGAFATRVMIDRLSPRRMDRSIRRMTRSLSCLSSSSAIRRAVWLTPPEDTARLRI